MPSRSHILLAAIEEWEDDESVPGDMTFDEWARENRPDLVPLLDSLPKSDRPLPVVEPDEPDEEEDDASEVMSLDEWVRTYRPDLIPTLDCLPKSDRPMPVIEPGDEDEA